MQINGLNPGIPSLPQSGQPSGAPGNFSNLLKHYVQKIEHQHEQAEHAATAMAEGKGGSVSETILAVEKADLSFQTLMAVRNKLVSAYTEVMHMQV
jgi:flagellar hook-basal body complex protein FliE